MFKPGPHAGDAEIALAKLLPAPDELEELLTTMRAIDVRSPQRTAARAQSTFEKLRKLFGDMAGEHGAAESMHFLRIVLPSLIEAARNGPSEEFRRWQEEHEDPRKVY